MDLVKLKKARKAARLTLKEIAKILEVDISYISKIENGSRLPSKQMVERLCSIYKLDDKEFIVEQMADKIIHEIVDEEFRLDALKLAEARLTYQKEELFPKDDFLKTEFKSKVKLLEPYYDKTFSFNEALKSVENKDITAISFFSGAGGLDFGAKLAGVDLRYSSDFDRDCIFSLKENFKAFDCKIQHEDISNFKASSIDKTVLKSAKNKLIVIGGPPCQPFSKAGYWVGNSNRLATADPRNMVEEYLRTIYDLKPDGFILENVESILHPTNRIAMEQIEEFIVKNNYKHIVYRANAADFGVPQKRKRVFVIASKKNLNPMGPTKTHGIWEGNSNNYIPHERVIDWIGRYSSDDFFEKEEVTTGGTYHDDLQLVPPGKNYIALTAHAGYPNPKFIAQKRFWSFLLKLDPFELSWTIAAQPGPWVGPFHWEGRRLRIPELAAIQTFPRDYIFCGTRRSQHKQIGNAVPPLLGKAIVNYLAENV